MAGSKPLLESALAEVGKSSRKDGDTGAAERLFPGRALIAPIRNGACNLLCEYCYISPKKYDPSRLTYEQHNTYIRQLLAYTSEATIRVVFIGGEPLLNLGSIKRVVRYWKNRSEAVRRQYGKDILFGIASNLTLLDEETADWLVEEDIAVCTSIDGPAETHNTCRKYRDGRGSFTETMRGFRLLQERGCMPGVLTTVTQPSRLGEIFDFLVSQGISRTNIRCVRTQMNPLDRSAWRSGAQYYRDMAKQTLKLADQIASHNKRRRNKVIDENIAAHVLHLVLPYNPYMCLRSPCGCGSGTKIGLASDGSIYPCDTMAGMTPLAIGHINDFNEGITLTEMVNNSPVMRRITRRRVENIRKCSKCTWQKHCGGGCTAVSYSIFHDLNRESDRCAYEEILFEGLLWKLVDDPMNYIYLTQLRDYS